MAVAWQNSGYNQPPHPGFFIGQGMPDPAMPNIFVQPQPLLEGLLARDGTYSSAVRVSLPVNQRTPLASEYRPGDSGPWTIYAGPS